MNGKQYLKNKLPMLVLNLVCMMALSAFLLLSGNSVDSISLILFVWLLVLAGSQALAYNSRKKQMEKLLRLTEQLDEQYLIAELMSLPEQADDQVFYQILKLEVSLTWRRSPCWSGSAPFSGNGWSTKSISNNGYMRSKHQLPL